MDVQWNSSMEETRGELYPERSLGNEQEGGGYGCQGKMGHPGREL